MSEKKLLIFGIFMILFLSTILFYLMIEKDIQEKNRSQKLFEEKKDVQINSWPKVEIEVRK